MNRWISVLIISAFMLSGSVSARADFEAEIPTNRVVTLRNGMVNEGALEISCKMGITPVSFEGAHCAISPPKVPLELFVRLSAHDNKVQQEEGALRVRLMHQMGEIYPVSLVFGLVEYTGGLAEIKATKMQPDWSPLLGANITLPMLKSHASLYIDSRLLALGIDYFLMYENFRGAISAIMQVDFIFDNEWRNKYHEDVLFQGGFRFRPSEFLNAAFTYENHDTIVFTVTVLMGNGD